MASYKLKFVDGAEKNNINKDNFVSSLSMKFIISDKTINKIRKSPQKRALSE